MLTASQEIFQIYVLADNSARKQQEELRPACLSKDLEGSRKNSNMTLEL